MPNVTCSQAVEADIQSIWRVFLDKVEHPQRYMAHVLETRFVEDQPDYVIREIDTEDMTLREKITLDERLGEVKFELIDHPLFTGHVLHAIIPPVPDLKNGLPVVTLTMDWTPKNEEGRAVEQAAQAEIVQNIEEATLYIKRMAEMVKRNLSLRGA